ncbi:MAG: hypothetical protein H7A18_01030 [Sinobacteraceae bacterium]|nr:hypothetical protein [Gammaproteobacteria bacterium]MCP5470650.1 hypothetical protein [Nevskiaceae bacterium]
MAQRKKKTLKPKNDRPPVSVRSRKVDKNRYELELFEKLVKSVALFLVSQGAKKSAISTSLNRALVQAEKLSKNAESLQSLYVEISKVLYAWHQHPSYIDTEARPRPLRLRGREPSIETLLQHASTRAPLEKIVDSLKSQKLIRLKRPGYFLPTASVARIRTNGPELTGYIGQSVLQFISTLQANYGNEAGYPLLERAAIVQDLPAREIPRFRQYSAEQGESLIASANSWLETRRKHGSQAGSRPDGVVTAGVHVFAFVTPSPRGAKH